MYWTKQEQFLFDIILFILVVCQMSTFFILIKDGHDIQNGIILVSLNLILLAAMIPYARWVWKTSSYQRAFLLVAKHEVLLLSLSAAVALLAILTIK